MFIRETSPDGKISFWTIRPEANRCLTLDQVYKVRTNDFMSFSLTFLHLHKKGKLYNFLCYCLSFCIFLYHCHCVLEFFNKKLSGEIPALNFLTIPMLCYVLKQYIISSSSDIICTPIFIFSAFKCILLSSLYGFLLIPHLTLQPGCDPMTVPVPVPMVLFPDKVRRIYHYLFSPLQSGARKQKRDRKVQLQCLFIPRILDPKSAAAAFDKA